MTDHYTVLGLARVRSAWFRDVGAWSTSGALPVDFVRCVSVDEVRARLASGRGFSALLVDGDLPALDRDLVDSAHATGCAVLAVHDRSRPRDWAAIGVDAVLAHPVTRGSLSTALREHAPTLPSSSGLPVQDGPAFRPDGRLVVVTGGGGVGTSTIAMALAQGLAAIDGEEAHVALADVALVDLARRADLALLHDTGDVVPGIQELVEAHRGHRLDPEQVRAHGFACPDRGYHLYLGLRRERDWTSLRPRALEASLDGLLHAHGVVVADSDPDVEGEAECGSLDVEERHALSRSALGRADAVVVVGATGVAGVHRATRILGEVLRFGVEVGRVLVVLNRGPRHPARRADLTRAVARSVEVLSGEPVPLAAPLHVPERRRLDEVHHDALPLPTALCAPVAEAVRAVLERVEPRRPAGPQPVRAGSLGTWADENLR